MHRYTLVALALWSGRGIKSVSIRSILEATSMQKKVKVRVFPAMTSHFAYCIGMAQAGWALLSTATRGGWTTVTLVRA